MATTDLAELADAPPARLDIPVLRAVRRGLELRAESQDGPGTLEGHFSVFNHWFEIDSWFEGHFLERTAPGSFKKTFDDWRSATDPHRIQVLLEHGWDPQAGDKPLGMAESLAEDRTGAAYVVPLFDAQYVRELIPALRAGAYSASYRFRVIRDKWDYEPPTAEHNPDGIPERTIVEQQVFEFGPTVFPANPSATAGVRSQTDHYYEQLRAANPRVYDEMVERATVLRTSAARDAAKRRTSRPADAANTPHDAPPNGTRRSPKQIDQARRRVLAKGWSKP